MSLPIHALLFVVYPIVAMVAGSPGQTTWQEVASVVALALLAATAIGVLLRPLLGSSDRAALGATLVVLFFYAYGPVYADADRRLLEEIARLGEHGAEADALLEQGRELHRMLSAGWAAGIVVGLAAIRFLAPQRTPKLNTVLNVMGGVLVGMAALQSLSTGTTVRVADDGRAASGMRGRALSVLGYNPDVYDIVLDGYARADVLQSRYGFDNRPFLDALRARGFQVAGASRSNYNWTFLSLASSLNFDFVQNLVPGGLEPTSKDRAPMYALLRDNAAARFLRGRGYRTVHLQTTWGGTMINPSAEEQVPCDGGAFGNELLRAVAGASWLGALRSRASMDVASCHLSNFASLSRMGSRPGPKFVFAHFLPPHHPYLFDEEGNVQRSATLSDQFEFQKLLWEDKAKYIAQMRFINRKVLEAIDAILATSPRPPVILLHSDHGPNLEKGLTRPERVEVRLANLAAFLLPGTKGVLVPEDASLVNLYRRLFNHYFEAGFPLLPEVSYFSPFAAPYWFQTVPPPANPAAAAPPAPQLP
jgi:hypothetical protein